MEVLAIIPARGGAKGIPRKNIANIEGKPLIAYTIEQALQSSKISRLVVSTDDPEIFNISIKYGAEVIERPLEISGDTASSESALLHALDFLKNKENYEPDILVFLQCTSPLTLHTDIDDAIEKLIEKQADCSFTAVPFHYFIWGYDKSGVLDGINHEKSTRLRRQDRDKQFLETGSVYVMKADGFKKHKHRFFGKITLHEIPKEHAYEIDEPIDREVVAAIIRARHKTSKLNNILNDIEAVIFDFDGVFTDNKVVVLQNGEEAVICDRGDGMGIESIKSLGIPILVLSKEKVPTLLQRCKKLKIECLHGVDDKLNVLSDWFKRNHISHENTIYVGNDINDIECMRFVGCPVAVADAYEEVKKNAKIILDSNGGNRAIRELCDLITSKYTRK